MRHGHQGLVHHPSERQIGLSCMQMQYTTLAEADWVDFCATWVQAGAHITRGVVASAKWISV